LTPVTWKRTCIKSARSTEMYMQLYFNLSGVLGTLDFNIAVVRAQ
jgi:hypothetical protein